jgi:hypothetical protein
MALLLRGIQLRLSPWGYWGPPIHSMPMGPYQHGTGYRASRIKDTVREKYPVFDRIDQPWIAGIGGVAYAVLEGGM